MEVRVTMRFDRFVGSVFCLGSVGRGPGEELLSWPRGARAGWGAGEGVRNDLPRPVGDARGAGEWRTTPGRSPRRRPRGERPSESRQCVWSERSAVQYT